MKCPHCKGTEIVVEEKRVYCKNCPVEVSTTGGIPVKRIVREIFGRKKYVRSKGNKLSFTSLEITKVWLLRYLPAKVAIEHFPGRNIASLNYLRRKTGAYRLYERRKDEV